LVVFPFCKINLGLSVLSKRDDGYHNLETCFFPVPWTDVLEVIPSGEVSFTTTGNMIPGSWEDNLCVKAYNLLKNDFDLPPVSIHLHKIIPAGAGLGGGSSDAAQTLKLLNEIFSLGLDELTLIQYAARLGSDCAFFVQDGVMIGTGRGEVLKTINFCLDKFLAVVKPDIHVSTKDAFSGIIPRMPEISIEDILLSKAIGEWKDILRNDFEETVFKKHPALAAIKKRLYDTGAIYASMSGSGSAVYGIFDDEIDLSADFKDATIWNGYVH
jgi:4-diphosphocytidyl-2-C-methyl-D-erythritol kinase